METARNCMFQPNVETFEKVGFKIIESNLLLPEGWRFKPDGEGNWGDILDNQERYRGFYRHDSDGITSITLVTRYTVESCHTLTNTFFSPIRIFVADQGTFYFNIGKCPYNNCGRREELRLIAKTHLDGKHPGWEDPSKYWD